MLSHLHLGQKLQNRVAEHLKNTSLEEKDKFYHESSNNFHPRLHKRNHLTAIKILREKHYQEEIFTIMRSR